MVSLLLVLWDDIVEFMSSWMLLFRWEGVGSDWEDLFWAKTINVVNQLDVPVPINPKYLLLAWILQINQKPVLYDGKIWRVLYLANEPFEPNWRFLIWRLMRGYYSNDVVYTPVNFTAIMKAPRVLMPRWRCKDMIQASYVANICRCNEWEMIDIVKSSKSI